LNSYFRHQLWAGL